MTASTLSPLLLVGALVLLALPATAHESESERDYEVAFDRTWAVGVYATGLEGEYGAIGLGGRLRLELLPILGLEVFAETVTVDWPGADRADFPVGFSLYVPIALTDSLRIRPTAGMCAMFSFIDGAFEERKGAQDIAFGLHGGAGIEYAFGSTVSVFADAKGIVYWSHERDVKRWTATVGETLEDTGHFQVNVGVQLHL